MIRGPLIAQHMLTAGSAKVILGPWFKQHFTWQRDRRPHKLNVRLRSHWGCHDLKLLNPTEVLPQPQTAADGLATEPKRNCT